MMSVRKCGLSLIWCLVQFYRRVCKPIMRACGFGPCCRFVPSCSEYMWQAALKHGPLKGFIMGIWRILRCNPFGGHGEDYP